MSTSAFGIEHVPVSKGFAIGSALETAGKQLSKPVGAAGVTGAGALAVGGVLHRKNKKIKQLEADQAADGGGNS